MKKQGNRYVLPGKYPGRPAREVSLSDQLVPALAKYEDLQLLANGDLPTDRREIADFLERVNPLISALSVASKDPGSGISVDQLAALRIKLGKLFPPSSGL